jgi:hypothetical protein
MSSLCSYFSKSRLRQNPVFFASIQSLSSYFDFRDNTRDYGSNPTLLIKSMYEKLPTWEPPNGNGHQKAEGVAAHANLGMFDATRHNQDVRLVKRAPGNANTPQFQNQTP